MASREAEHDVETNSTMSSSQRAPKPKIDRPPKPITFSSRVDNAMPSSDQISSSRFDEVSDGALEDAVGRQAAAKLQRAETTPTHDGHRSRGAPSPVTDVDVIDVDYKSCKLRPSSVTLGQGRLVGHGVFSNVYVIAQLKPVVRQIAIKKTFPERDEEIQKLIAIHRSLYHRHISRLLFYFTRSGVGPRPCWTLAFDYMPTTMRAIEEAIERRQDEGETGAHHDPLLVKVWSYQLLRALMFMHSQNIGHRDIKPENMLVDEQTQLVKLTDLGSARWLRPDDEHGYSAYQVTRLQTMTQNHHYYVRVDVWAAGCVVGGLALGSVMFCGENGDHQMPMIMATLGTPTADDLMALCPKRVRRNRLPAYLTSMVSERIDWRCMKPTPFDKEYHSNELLEFLTRSLVYNPSHRLSAADLCQLPYFDEIRRSTCRLPNGRPVPIREAEFEKPTNMDMEGARDPLRTKKRQI